MKDSLKPGDSYVHHFTVTKSKTVPHLFPESPDFRTMPEIFATGYMVGLMEWACIEAIKPHLEEGEGSLGVDISVSHVAPTPPGMEVTVTVTCRSVSSRRVSWHVRAEDEKELIGEGTHDRAVVRWGRFKDRLVGKSRLPGP